MIDRFTVHWFAGYGSIKWETTLPAGVQRFTSNGARVGFDALYPLYIGEDGSNWAINGIVAWYPSNIENPRPVLRAWIVREADF